MNRLILFGLIVFGPVPSSGQPAQRPLSFDAAAIKPTKGQTPSQMGGGPGTKDPGRITYSNVTLADMIQTAYNVRSYQIKGGASWLDSERFEVIATVPGGATKEDVRAMLQSLLADRFKLAVHHETKEGRTYNLVVDKGGPKLKAAADNASTRGSIGIDDNGAAQLAPGALGRPVTLAGNHIAVVMSAGRAMILGNSQTVSALALRLVGLVDGPVQDLTGLTGKYDFSLTFESTGLRVPTLGPAGECTNCANDESLPGLFSALKEQLGLRLEPGRGPIDLVVIDQLEKGADRELITLT